MARNELDLTSAAQLLGKGDIVLTIRDLAHEFQTEAGTSLPVIRNVSAMVHRGETIAIVGPSGSGKTTFLNLIAGRLRATSGQIHFAGVADSGAAGPGHLGMVFQQPSLLPWRTIGENISLPLELMSKNKNSATRVAAALDRVGLTGFKDYLPSQVSGGMQSRAALARALVTAPGILLMDEPFGALDEMTAETLNVVLSSVLRENNVTTLVVTHQLMQAVFLADRVWVFSARPATLAADIRIDALAPRTPAFLENERFYASVIRIRSVMRTL